jgi:hypothetical protein
MTRPAASPLADPHDVPAPYYFLWHLAALNVLQMEFGQKPSGSSPTRHESALRDSTGAKVIGTVWDKLRPPEGKQLHPARIALIDTGTSLTHPNLRNQIAPDSAIDLSTHRHGARCLPLDGTMGAHIPEGSLSFFDGLDITRLELFGLDADDQNFLNALVEELRTSRGVTRRVLDPNETTASHGTAVAGLMVGAPTEAANEIARATWPETGGNGTPATLPYFGVDPFSTLIPIRTSFEDDPHQFIAAFLYAWNRGADVIVLPRGLPDPLRGRIGPKSNLKPDPADWQSRETADLFHRLGVVRHGLPPAHEPQPRATDLRLWTILEHLILAISTKIPVVCAAGNDGESQLIYPARLAADPDNGLIAVGAVTAEGFRSGYSNYGTGLTVVAPSDDIEVFNRHQQRLDILMPGFDGPAPGDGGRDAIAYCHLALITTDLPGVFGYDAGTTPWSRILPHDLNPGIGGGHYTTFGGTSGAAGLIGGVVALVQRAHKLDHGEKARLGGAKMKAILTKAANACAVVAPGHRQLSPDRMNGHAEEVTASPHDFFGAGLVDATKAVALARRKSR